MPYIQTDTVAMMRKGIKTALPAYNISVTKHHHSSVQVNIMSGPIPAVDVNHYWYKEHLKDNPAALALVDTIMEQIAKVRPQQTMSEDGDYGSIPNFYINIRFGKWDKPYIQTAKEVAA